MKEYNLNDVAMDACAAMEHIMEGRECWLLIDPDGEYRGKVAGTWTGPDTAEAAIVFWGAGDHPDLAARDEDTWEEADALGAAFVGAFEKIRDGLEEHYGVRLPETDWYGRSWEYHFQQAGWKVLSV